MGGGEIASRDQSEAKILEGKRIDRTAGFGYAEVLKW